MLIPRSQRNSFLALHVCLAFCLSAVLASGQEASYKGEVFLKRGLIVESLSKNEEGEKAGIKPGDVLLSWSRGVAKGEIASPFDLPFIRTEQASRGPLRLRGLRGTGRRTWLIGCDLWGIWTHPDFHGELLAAYQKGQELANAGKLDEAFVQWQKAITIAEEHKEISWLVPWLLSRAAQMYGRQWEKSDDLFRQAIQRAGDTRPEVTADLLRQRAQWSELRGDFIHMQEYREEELRQLRKLDGEMAASNTLLSLAWVAERRGDFEKADQFAKEALRISQADAPQSVETVIAFQSVGATALDRGDLAAAARYEERALERVERYFPRSYHAAQVLDALGNIARRGGELAKARTYFQRAISVAERSGGPDSRPVADALNRLSECLVEQGDLQGAERHELRALAIWQKTTPGSLSVATSLRNLGNIARIRKDLVQARDDYQQALEIGEHVAPQSEETGRFLIGLGYVARDGGDPVLAEAYFRKALVIIDKSAPGNLNHAETLADLAEALQGQHKLAEATKTYEQALAELSSHWDGQREERSHYRAYRAVYYEHYVEALVQQALPERAFEAVEASRARALLEMLSESQIDIHQGADSVLLARERKLRQLLNTQSQARIHLLSGKHTDDEVSRVDQEISDLRDQIAQVETDMRITSPQFAALTDPQALNTKRIQQLLDSNTVLLEYSLGDKRSYVWLLTDDSLRIFELPKRAEIETLAANFYSALTARTRNMNTAPEKEAASWARTDSSSEIIASQLGQILLGPVANLIEGKRLLVVADGALQYIPFSALPSPQNLNEPLIVQHEIVNLPSASVLAEIRQVSSSRSTPAREVAVLADPVFAPNDERVTPGAAGSVAKPRGTFRGIVRRSASDIGLQSNNDSYLERLIYSRKEAEAIVAIAPHTKALLDFQASRRMALSPELANYRIVHFATHGFMDNKHPEFSGLVLSLVDKRGKPQDGFLGLEDIYNLKLPVDLVVLSGCQTGLGEEIRGEGLVGLTRGFMYAGASRVMASVWSVDDYSTSQLMKYFYRSLERDKMRPAAALRQAQIDMWKHKDSRAPYYWAAFQLQGEWQ